MYLQCNTGSSGSSSRRSSRNCTRQKLTTREENSRFQPAFCNRPGFCRLNGKEVKLLVGWLAWNFIRLDSRKDHGRWEIKCTVKKSEVLFGNCEPKLCVVFYWIPVVIPRSVWFANCLSSSGYTRPWENAILDGHGLDEEDRCGRELIQFSLSLHPILRAGPEKPLIHQIKKVESNSFASRL